MKIIINTSLICFVAILLYIPTFYTDTNVEIKQKKAHLIKKHLKRLKKQEGGIKLVGGRAEFEGMLKYTNITISVIFKCRNKRRFFCQHLL